MCNHRFIAETDVLEVRHQTSISFWLFEGFICVFQTFLRGDILLAAIVQRMGRICTVVTKTVRFSMNIFG